MLGCCYRRETVSLFLSATIFFFFLILLVFCDVPLKACLCCNSNLHPLCCVFFFFFSLQQQCMKIMSSVSAVRVFLMAAADTKTQTSVRSCMAPACSHEA